MKNPFMCRVDRPCQLGLGGSSFYRTRNKRPGVMALWPSGGPSTISLKKEGGTNRSPLKFDSRGATLMQDHTRTVYLRPVFPLVNSSGCSLII